MKLRSFESSKWSNARALPFWIKFQFWTKFESDFLSGLTELDVPTNVLCRSTCCVHCVKVSRNLETKTRFWWIFYNLRTLTAPPQWSTPPHQLCEFWKMPQHLTSAMTNRIAVGPVTSWTSHMEEVNKQLESQLALSIVDTSPEV